MSLNRKLFSKSASDAVCNSESLEPFGEEASFNKNVAVYQFEDNANDSSGNGKNGTEHNGVAYSASGKFGKAASFDGTNDYISLPHSIETDYISAKEFAISVWVKTDTIPTGSDEQHIISFVEDGYCGLKLLQNGVLHAKVAEVTSGTDREASSPSSTISTGTWYHIVWTGKTNDLKLYVDGSLVASNSTWNGTFFSSGYGDGVGCKNPEGTPEGFWDGLIDQLRVYSKALTAEEVTTLYLDETTSTASSTTIIPGTSCIAYYPLDYDGQDKSTNYDGTPSNVEFVQNGKINYSALFNGSSSKIDLPDNILPTNSTASSSSTCWFKTSYTGANMGTIFSAYDSYGGGTSSTPGFGLWTEGNQNFLRMASYYLDGSNVVGTDGTTNVSDGNWHFIAVVFDISANTLKCYLDGNSSPEISITGLTTSTVDIWTANASIGYQKNPGGASPRYFNGEIDEVRIFNKALSASEITTLYGLTACTPTCTTDNDSFPSTNVAYYKLDGDATDSHGGTYDGTATNITYASGRFGSAASFNGSNSTIDTGYTPPAGSGDFSVSCWVSLGATGLARGIWATTTNSGTDRLGLGLTVNSSNVLNIRVFDSAGVDSFNGSTLVLNTWYHIVITYDGGLTRMYVNGNLQSGSVNQSISSHHTSIHIGNYYGSLDSANMWSGLIDQFRVYTSVLTDSYVQDLYDTEFQCYITKNATDPFGGSSEKAFYKFEDNVNDSTGSFDGSVTGSITYSSTNPAFGSKSASGFSTSNYINIPAITDVIDNAASDNFTFSIWFRLNAIPASSSNFYTICGIHNADVSGSNGQMWEVNLFGTSTSNEIEVRTRRGYGGNVYDPSSYGLTKVVAADTWYNLVCAYTGSTKVNQIYINGSLLGSNTLNSAASRTIGNGFNLGTYSNDGSSHSAYAFNGLLDQCRIFNTTLTGEQVWKLYAERNN